MAIPWIPAPADGTLLFAAVSLAAVLAAAWVYRDGRRREVAHPAIWASAVGFLFLFYVVGGIVALIVYLALRDQLGPGQPTDDPAVGSTE